MEALRKLPILGELTLVEQAKLLPDLLELDLEVGSRLSEEQLHTNIFFVVQGRASLRTGPAEGDILVGYVHVGEIIGEPALAKDAKCQLEAVAVEPTQLVSVKVETFRDLLRDKPHLSLPFSNMLLDTAAGRLCELARVRRMMASYSEALWEEANPPEDPVDHAAAQVAAATIADEAPSRSHAGMSLLLRSLGGNPLTARLLSVAVATLIAGGFALWSGSAIKLDQTRYIFAWMLWGSICWLFNALPDYVVALTTCLGLLITGLSPPAEALAGFINPTWFLLLGVWCIGVAIGRTGLIYRVALHILRWLPSTYIGQSLALAVTGTLMTPLLPSSQGRVVMSAPLTLELGEAMRLPHRSNGSTGLAMASFLGFGQMYFLFLNGTTTSILAWSLLPPEWRAHASWLNWLAAALPAGILIFGLTYWATIRMLPVKQIQGVSRALIAAQLRVLGPMHPKERVGLVVMVLVLIAFATMPLHQIDPAWFAVGGMLILLAANVLEKETLSAEVDWAFLLFFGAVLSISNVARITHLDAVLGEIATPALALVQHHPVALIFGVGLITLVLRLALSPIQVIPLLTIALIPIFLQAGYNPFAAILTVAVASTTFIAPALSPGYVAMQSGTRGRMFTNRDILPLALVHSLILVIGLLLSVPYWRYLGAM